MPRPVDVHVTDRQGRPVAGLSGSLFAIRPSDTRLNQAAPLVAIPQSPGRYRTLVRLDAPGAWDVRLDMRQGGLRFVHAARLTVPGEAAGGKEGGR
jgi:nitrogen fixation protein FixH